MAYGSPTLHVQELTKRYGGVTALRGVSLTVPRGEVHAILGKNGAGKSTLVNILCGAVQPDSGSVYIDGVLTRLKSPLDAHRRGVVTVHQETHVVPDLTVAENIMLGRWGRRGMVDQRRVRAAAVEALDRLRSDLRPDQTCAHLSIASWQTIEIARALTQDVRALVLDEPTSALSVADADVLLATVRGLASAGVGVIYVTHRLDEIPRVADRLTVIREGIAVATIDARQTSPGEMVELMVGRRWAGHAGAHRRSTPEPPPRRKVALKARGISVPDRVFGVDLDVYAGEILGIAGLVGAGRSELLRAIYGAIPSEGRVTIDGTVLRRRAPWRLQSHGVSFVPDDRKREGLFPQLSVAENISLGNLAALGRYGVVSRRARAQRADDAIASLAIKVHNRDQIVDVLSGGNQQKVVIARALAGGARILLLDEPTRGVDVDAKFQIYELLRRLRDQGVSIVVAPSEFDEFPLICDRVVVLRNGTVAGEANGQTQPSVLLDMVLGNAAGGRAVAPIKEATRYESIRQRG